MPNQDEEIRNVYLEALSKIGFQAHHDDPTEFLRFQLIKVSSQNGRQSPEIRIARLALKSANYIRLQNSY